MMQWVVCVMNCVVLCCVVLFCVVHDALSAPVRISLGFAVAIA